MINDETLLSALETVVTVNEDSVLASPVCDKWDCPLCGQSYLKIFCATDENPYDLVMWNTHDGGGWQVFDTVDPDSPLTCDCTNMAEEA